MFSNFLSLIYVFIIDGFNSRAKERAQDVAYIESAFVSANVLQINDTREEEALEVLPMECFLFSSYLLCRCY
jgi:hypothetical protein